MSITASAHIHLFVIVKRSILYEIVQRVYAEIVELRKFNWRNCIPACLTLHVMPEKTFCLPRSSLSSVDAIL